MLDLKKMAQTRFWLLILCLVSQLAVTVSGCNSNSCLKDVLNHIGDYVECDMCNCDKLCDLEANDEYYKCSVKLNSALTEFECKVQMTSGWYAGFVIIAVVGVCCLGGIIFLIYRFFCKKSVGSGGLLRNAV